MPNQNIRILIVGDCSTWNLPDFSSDQISSDMHDLIGSSDLFIFNLEGPLTANSTVNPGKPPGYCLIGFGMRCAGKKPQPLVTGTTDILKLARLAPRSIACLANNHILDAGAQGLKHTLQQLNDTGIMAVGAGMNRANAIRPLITDVKGQRLAIMNFNLVGFNRFGFFINIYGAGFRSPGAAYLDFNNLAVNAESLKKKVDRLIIILHMGRELKVRIDSIQEAWLALLKADVIVIHHAHVRQEIDIPHVVSVGDFVFSYPGHLPVPRSSQVCQLNLTANQQQILRIPGQLMSDGMFHADS